MVETPTAAEEAGEVSTDNVGCSQIASQIQAPLKVINKDGVMAIHTNSTLAQDGEAQVINGTSTASAQPPDIHQALPIIDLAATLQEQHIASLPYGNEKVTCRPVSDAEREAHVMDTIFLCCLHFNFHLSQHRSRNFTTTIRAEVCEIQRQVKDVLELPYERALAEIRREHISFYSKKVQTRYMETIFWHFIEDAARRVNFEDCSVPRGPIDGFTRQEKQAHRDFMEDAGYKTGASNTRRYRLLWKNLYAMREGGIDKILFYRTKEFNSFCETFHDNTIPSLLDIVKSWEERYGPQISLLEKRVASAAKNELSDDPFRDHPDIAERLKVERKSWNSHSNHWHSRQEAVRFIADHGLLQANSSLQGVLRDIPTKRDRNRDMSMFVIMQPRGSVEITVCSVVTIKPGDFLGIFSGEIRYTNSVSETHGIPGPEKKLWLDYSRTTGALNLMRVSLPGQDANVHLRWESYRPDKNSQTIWRVAVRAASEIKPFAEITRSACHELQYQLHQDLISARNGFLRFAPVTTSRTQAGCLPDHGMSNNTFAA